MRLTRREFTKVSMGAGALCAVGGGAAIASQDTMLHKSIPSTGEKIPVIGVGTNRYGVGNDAELRAPLKAALEKFHGLGASVIDTAPMYRSSEVVLGELIAELAIDDDLFMATKVDVEGRDQVLARMQQSFDRLNRKSMDLMQIHNLIGWQDALPVMQEWKEAGRIRYIGVTTSRERQYEEFEQIMRKVDLDFVQINYSVADQRASADRILPMAADRGMAVLANRPFGGGGVFEKLAKATMPEWAAEIDISSWGQFMLKYVISHPAVTCAIPGMTKARHVEDNLVAATGRMPTGDERRRMEAFFDGL